MIKRTTLFKKYALIFGALTGFSLIVSGLLSISYSYQENKLALVKLQREKAESAAARIGQNLFDIEQRINQTTTASAGHSSLEQRSTDIQYLRRLAAINEITLLDRHGKEYLRVRRGAPDVVRSGKDLSTTDGFRQVQSGRPYRSPVYFREGGLYMTTAMAVGPEEAGITISEIDLEFLLAAISSIKVGDSGHAYVVDATGRLIAHPNIGLVLKDTSLSTLPQVQAAIGQLPQSNDEVMHSRSFNGDDVLSAYSAIPQLGWFVFVEEPLADAYQPLYAQAIRNAILVIVGVLLTLVAVVTLVRRMVKPIGDLREGAKLIGQGVLDHRIAINTGDELEDLGNGFNLMAEKLQESYATLERRVAERTHELAISLTEINLKQSALQESENKLSDILENLDAYIYLKDINGRYLYANRLVCELFGASMEEILAQGDARFFSTESLVEMHRRESMVLNDGKILKYEGTDKFSDGRTVTFLSSKIPLRNEAGEIYAVCGISTDITERKRMEDQIRQLAFQDTLTMLPNRRLLNDRLMHAMAANKRNGRFGALMFLDLDNFKPLNDKYGHEVGDLLLIEAANRLKGCVRQMDTVARFGGDEFIVMISELESNNSESTVQANLIAEKIRLELSQPYLLEIKHARKSSLTIEHHCTVSIGVVLFDGREMNHEEILNRADTAMYRVKEAGRNSIALWEPNS